jgi:hypothetical protein
MEAMLFFCTLILAGAIVYGSNDQAGALLMAAGITLALVRGLWQAFFKNRLA